MLTTTPTPARQASRALARMIAVRVVGVVFILLVISLLTFGLMYLAPGDLVKNLLGNRPTSPEAVAAIREQYRLDDPFFVQYFTWLGNALQGDFGTSVRMQQPVTTVIGARVGLTVALCLLAFVIAAIVAIPLGIASAARAGSTIDRVSSSVTLIGLSAPTFALALLLLYLFAFFLPIFPIYGGGSGPLDTLYHLVLPAIILAAGLGAILMRMTRAAMIRELGSDAVSFARARGIAERDVRWIALRAAAIPIVTGAGLVLTFLVGGTIIVETIFALPGLGSLLQDSVLFKDIPVVQALTLVVAAVIAVIAIVVDLSYLALDPRVRTREFAR
ncbi:ABC transporter permease [Leucobacter sp. W1038]|uniref:ABC transporter permease n=1 Tax=Leucobacter sp. W1038 TaxID=3438281 RepID=UPI003D96C0E6